MKILFLTYNFIGPQQPGSIRAWQIAHFLQGRGHRVTVITGRVHYMTGKGKAQGGGDRGSAGTDGVTVRYIDSPVGNPRKSRLHRILHDSLMALGQAVAAVPHAGRCDLILSASPPILTPLMACGLAFCLRRPHLFEVRDMLADGLKAGEIVRNPLFVGLIERLERLCFRASHGLIAVTPGIRRLLLAKGVGAGKIRLVTNGVEDDLYRVLPDGDSLRRQWGIPRESRVVLFSGTLSTFSNVGLLLAAVRLLRDRGGKSLLVVIAGEGQRREAYEAYCRRHGLGNVRFIGARPRTEIPGLCRMADMCVHMFKEGPFWDIFFSNKLFDYMAAGRPVIYAGGGDSADLIRRAKGGVVVRAEDPSALADTLAWLAGEDEIRTTLGNNGRAFVLRHYSRRALLADMEACMQTLVRRSPNGKRAAVRLAASPVAPLTDA